jgi:monomeric sarcosine oxidase
MPHYDAIVLGAGGIGSAALYELARRGVRAVGVDRFSPPHDRGSSHGQTRVIRQAYFEHPDYVPLVVESYSLWRELEQLTGRRLLHESGLVEIGPPNGVVVPGVLRAAAQHGLEVERLSAGEVERRWPGLRAPEDSAAVYEPSAGYLAVEDCVAAHLEAARAAGAQLLVDTAVVGWQANENEVCVQTTRDEFVAERLVVTAGAWATPILRDLSLRLTVLRKSLFWFDTTAPQYNATAGMPVYLFEFPSAHILPERGNDVFYGFPKLDARGVKVGEHTGGRVVEDPKLVDRAVDPLEQLAIESFLRAHLPGVSTRVIGHSVCLYTMSPDEHFIVDRHPAHPNVVFAVGLSGHGFKFAPVLGRALADLALDGQTLLPIDFLSLKRFSLFK